jgi:hypothetical protein
MLRFVAAWVKALSSIAIAIRPLFELFANQATMPLLTELGMFVGRPELQIYRHLTGLRRQAFGLRSFGFRISYCSTLCRCK